MKSKTTKLFFIILCSILIIYVIYTIYNLIKSSRVNNNINNFEDVPNNTLQLSETTTPIVTAMAIPADEQIQTCTANNNIVGFCMNYDGCCAQQKSESKKCFCEHPFVQNCKNIYDECTKTSPTKNECKEKLKECCISYNKINIDSSNFGSSIMQDQTTQKICSIGSINGLSDDSMSLKCMELCQTTPECKAYSIDNINCKLFSSVNPLPTKPFTKILTDYYIKK